MERFRDKWIATWLDASASKRDDDLAQYIRERGVLGRKHGEGVARRLLADGKVFGNSVEVKLVRYFRDEDGVPDEQTLETHEVTL